MTAHDHAEHVPGCFRCDLSREEVSPPLTLDAFLLARIAEDEAAVKPYYDAPDFGTFGEGYDVHGADGRSGVYLTIDPARILARCAADRLIVEQVARNVREIDEGWCARLLGLLALPYAEHPDYREEWKPDA